MNTHTQDILEHYVHYINLWWNEDAPADERDPYTVEKFTVSDHSRGLYGECRVEELVVGSGLIVDMWVTDGDEGGGSYITAAYRKSFVDDDDLDLKWIMHEFDTIPEVVWTSEDGYRKP